MKAKHRPLSKLLSAAVAAIFSVNPVSGLHAGGWDENHTTAILEIGLEHDTLTVVDSAGDDLLLDIFEITISSCDDPPGFELAFIDVNGDGYVVPVDALTIHTEDYDKPNPPLFVVGSAESPTDSESERADADADEDTGDDHGGGTEAAVAVWDDVDIVHFVRNHGDAAGRPVFQGYLAIECSGDTLPLPDLLIELLDDSDLDHDHYLAYIMIELEYVLVTSYAQGSDVHFEGRQKSQPRRGRGRQ